jgi:hypothetical protein
VTKRVGELETAPYIFRRNTDVSGGERRVALDKEVKMAIKIFVLETYRME